MNRGKQDVISLLNQSYSFLSISGKNSDFFSSVSKDAFFFRGEAASDSRRHAFLMPCSVT